MVFFLHFHFLLFWDPFDLKTGVRKVTFDARDESTTGNIVSKSTEVTGVKKTETTLKVKPKASPGMKKQM